MADAAREKVYQDAMNELHEVIIQHKNDNLERSMTPFEVESTHRITLTPESSPEIPPSNETEDEIQEVDDKYRIFRTESPLRHIGFKELTPVTYVPPPLLQVLSPQASFRAGPQQLLSTIEIQPINLLEEKKAAEEEQVAPTELVQTFSRVMKDTGSLFEAIQNEDTRRVF
ncbi:hypothetical protein GUITHDRAFT_139731 [Guillardia theta CCMP2712]|uniref:Uncharacterized protein n=1 Tax=Guillardia theta (strain CCMP2712) TaxID=905079 RepID=L1J833_GUITC|nr:hypothetical protein GUITHDRAFT_139731 [Guillardia theta CCMP2712]EKX44492.1 hypothetical protein GUITHDRAFT_139731 [Guillardia theta CCMP2712]|eukprot:XP_005831472.1 hypothetical protein GUITHDRAFT_139731 [Guillardia theta CCMP2712]